MPKNLILNEHEWTIQWLIPFLARLGFRRVTYTHGTLEAGRDVVFAEIDRFGLFRYFAAQVKIGTVHAESATREIGTILEQVRNAYETPYRDEATGTEHKMAGVYLIVHGTVSESAKNILYSKTGQWLHIVDDSQLVVAERLSASISVEERHFRIVRLKTDLFRIRQRLAKLQKDVNSYPDSGRVDIDVGTPITTRSIERVLDFSFLYLPVKEHIDLIELLEICDQFNLLLQKTPWGDFSEREAELIIGILKSSLKVLVSAIERGGQIVEKLHDDLKRETA